jgi:multidrug efflux pump subunit AcrA (membrane-fusion protein)
MTASRHIQSNSLNLLVLFQEIQQLVESKAARENQVLAVLQLLLRLTNAAGAFHSYVEQSQLIGGQRILSTQALTWHSNLETLFLEQAQCTLEKQEVQIFPLDKSQQLYILTTPIHNTETIALILVLGEQRLEMFVTILQLIAGYLTISPQHTSTNTDWLMMLSNVFAIPDINKAFQTLLHTIQHHFKSQRVILGLQKAKHCRVESISEIEHFKRQADIVHVSEALMKTTLLLKAPLTSDNKNSEIEQILKITSAQSLLSIPLPMLPEGFAGVLIILWEQKDQQIQLDKWKSLAPALGMVALALKRARPHWWQRWWLNAPMQRNRRILKLTLWLGFLLIMMIPIPHRVAGSITLEPTVHRFVNAPFDGILKKAFHLSGDQVKMGELLAELDGKEIEWQLSGLKAEKSRAQKQKDVSAAARDASAIQIAQLEIERIDAQLDLLEYRLANLQIKSPLDGIVISGDLKRAEGSPLTKGHVLFEIAPLDNMLIQMAISVDDISYVIPNQVLSIILDAYPNEIFEQTITKIQPRAITRDAQQVFILEAKINNVDGRLHPGLKGRGRVYAGNEILGWVILHKAWEHLFKWIAQ